jgi:hypothetical protein
MFCKNMQQISKNVIEVITVAFKMHTCTQKMLKTATQRKGTN